MVVVVLLGLFFSLRVCQCHSGRAQTCRYRFGIAPKRAPAYEDNKVQDEHPTVVPLERELEMIADQVLPRYLEKQTVLIIQGEWTYRYIRVQAGFHAVVNANQLLCCAFVCKKTRQSCGLVRAVVKCVSVESAMHATRGERSWRLLALSRQSPIICNTHVANP